MRRSKMTGNNFFPKNFLPAVQHGSAHPEMDRVFSPAIPAAVVLPPVTQPGQILIFERIDPDTRHVKSLPQLMLRGAGGSCWNS